MNGFIRKRRNWRRRKLQICEASGNQMGKTYSSVREAILLHGRNWESSGGDLKPIEGDGQ
jgi:hypothetical protein